MGETCPGDVAVSCIGTIGIAKVIPQENPEPFIAASMYVRWLGPHPTAVGDWIYSNASAHSIISDLTAFIGYYDRPDKHRILAAGDLNISFWSTDQFDHRAQTVMDRFQALGLKYMGPQYPAGRRAHPIPDDPNEDSLDVPTYHTSKKTPAGAHVQIDHVFASRGFHEEVETWALNEVADWGPRTDRGHMNQRRGSTECRTEDQIAAGPVGSTGRTVASAAIVDLWLLTRSPTARSET